MIRYEHSEVCSMGLVVNKDCDCDPKRWICIDTLEGREALKALLTESQVVGAVILAASNPVFDDGHTDSYYEGLLAAAVAALAPPEEDT